MRKKPEIQVTQFFSQYFQVFLVGFFEQFIIRIFYIIEKVLNDFSVSLFGFVTCISLL